MTRDSKRLTFAALTRRTKWLLILWLVGSPIALIALVELAVRLSGVETELVPNDNVEIAIPAWLMADDNFAAGLQPGLKAHDVVWLRHFTEARYIKNKI